MNRPRPWSSCRRRPPCELLAAQRAGLDVGIALGARKDVANPERGFVAGFSSRGLAFDGAVKPNVAAPGVALATSEPGLGERRLAALRHRQRHERRGRDRRRRRRAARADAARRSTATALNSLLVGYAARGGAPAVDIGAGTFRLGASAVGEVAAQPSTLGFGIWDGPRWHATRTLVVRNVSTRRLQLSISALVGRRVRGARASRSCRTDSCSRTGRAARVSRSRCALRLRGARTSPPA